VQIGLQHFPTGTFHIDWQVSQGCAINVSSGESTFWRAIVMRWTKKKNPQTEKYNIHILVILWKQCIMQEIEFHVPEKLYWCIRNSAINKDDLEQFEAWKNDYKSSCTEIGHFNLKKLPYHMIDI